VTCERWQRKTIVPHRGLLGLLLHCNRQVVTRVMEDMERLWTASIHTPDDWHDSGDHVIKTRSTAADPLLLVTATDEINKYENLQCQTKQAYPSRHLNIVVFIWSKADHFEERTDGPTESQTRASRAQNSTHLLVATRAGKSSGHASAVPVSYIFLTFFMVDHKLPTQLQKSPKLKTSHWFFYQCL